MTNILRLLIIASIMTGLLSLGVITASAQSSSIVHVVQIGDTLSSIAVYYGSTVARLSADNGIPYPYWIFPGQRITILLEPSSPIPPFGPTAPSATHHVVQWGENLFRIGLHYGWDVNTMAAANGLVYPYTVYAGQWLTIPRRSLTHVVQYGETVGSIAVRYGSTTGAIVAANRLANPNLIYGGQVLTIP